MARKKAELNLIDQARKNRSKSLSPGPLERQLAKTDVELLTQSRQKAIRERLRKQQFETRGRLIGRGHPNSFMSLSLKQQRELLEKQKNAALIKDPSGKKGVEHQIRVADAQRRSAERHATGATTRTSPPPESSEVYSRRGDALSEELTGLSAPEFTDYERHMRAMQQQGLIDEKVAAAGVDPVDPYSAAQAAHLLRTGSVPSKRMSEFQIRQQEQELDYKEAQILLLKAQTHATAGKPYNEYLTKDLGIIRSTIIDFRNQAYLLRYEAISMVGDQDDPGKALTPEDLERRKSLLAEALVFDRQRKELEADFQELRDKLNSNELLGKSNPAAGPGQTTDPEVMNFDKRRPIHLPTEEDIDELRANPNKQTIIDFQEAFGRGSHTNYLPSGVPGVSTSGQERGTAKF